MDLNNPEAFGVRVNPKSPVAEQVASFVNDAMARKTDAASKIPGAPPLFGEEVTPHVMTFASMIGSYARAYVQSDEALQDSWDNARCMRNDVGIMECVESRQRMTAQLETSIEAENDKHYGQVSLARELERIVKRIRRFPEYKRNLMEAIWYGRYAIQNKYGWQQINGRQRLMPSAPVADHPGWLPIHGDKLVFRYDNGLLKPELGEYAPMCGQVGKRISFTNLARQNRPAKRWLSF
jgi:hypothetical protein